MTMVGTGKYTYKVIQDWAKWPPGMKPAEATGVASDSEDRVYVCRAKGPHVLGPPVVVFDREGNFLTSWGNGATVFAHALYIANDIVYLVDRDSSVCIIYTLDGKPIQMLGRHGMHSDTGIRTVYRVKENDPPPRAAGPFNYPAKMVSSPWGDLYVADGHRNARVHRFDSGGHLIQSWGIWGTTAPGELHAPHSVLATRDGRIYVCDRFNNRIQVFSPNGEFIAMWPDVMGPSDIAETPEGDFAVTEIWGGPEGPALSESTWPALLEQELAFTYRISILDREGRVLTRLDARNHHAICVDSQGDMYLAIGRRHAVDKYVYQGRVRP